MSPCTHVALQDRRHFLRLAGAAGLVGFAGTVPLHALAAAKRVEALLLSCMDYRLTGATTRYMNQRHLARNYDHIVLAGGALGAQTDKFPAWRDTFWEHLQIAIDLHRIRRVILLDHRDCGAYKVILGRDFAKFPAEERKVHAAQLDKLSGAIVAKYPALKVERLLMALDGKVETIA